MPAQKLNDRLLKKRAQMKEAVGGLPAEIFAFLSAIGVIFLLPKTVSGLYESLDLQGAVAVFIFGVYTLYLLFRLNQIYIAWGRDRKYAHILRILNGGFAHIHNSLDENGDGAIDLKEAKRACESVCDAVADALSHVTSATCAVCVKVMCENPAGEGLIAHGIARDRYSRKDRELNDRLDRVVHPVQGNTAFRTLFENLETVDENYYIHGDLPHDQDYENTSFETYGQRQKEDGNRWFERREWPLPYKSVLVVPIAPNTPGSRPKIADLAGFLCVDSPGYHAFRVEHDVALIQGVADALYNLIKDVQVSEDRNATARQTVDSELDEATTGSHGSSTPQ